MEVLESGEPIFPFCLGWANASWTGVWYGAPEKVIVEQTYGGEPDSKPSRSTPGSGADLKPSVRPTDPPGGAALGVSCASSRAAPAMPSTT